MAQRTGFALPARKPGTPISFRKGPQGFLGFLVVDLTGENCSCERRELATPKGTERTPGAKRPETRSGETRARTK
jgi:hypothetical protein